MIIMMMMIVVIIMGRSLDWGTLSGSFKGQLSALYATCRKHVRQISKSWLVKFPSCAKAPAPTLAGRGHGAAAGARGARGMLEPGVAWRSNNKNTRIIQR